MQAPTHLISGVVIDKLSGKSKLPIWCTKILTPSLSFLSHGLLDALSRLTYHPPHLQPDDRFWSIYHHKILPLATGAIMIKHWKQHKLAMLFSILPDVDWIIRAIRQRYPRIAPFWNQPILNNGLNKLVTTLPFLDKIETLPNWKHRKKAALVETGLFIALVGIAHLLNRNNPS